MKGFNGIFRLIKDVNADGKILKKGKKFNCYGGLVRGVWLSSGNTINFDDRDYFAQVIHRK